MGKRRRKLLSPKYVGLSWNRHHKASQQSESITEEKISKIIEDNSVILERMNRISNTCDEIVNNIEKASVVDDVVPPAVQEPEKSIEQVLKEVTPTPPKTKTRTRTRTKPTRRKTRSSKKTSEEKK